MTAFIRITVSIATALVFTGCPGNDLIPRGGECLFTADCERPDAEQSFCCNNVCVGPSHPCLDGGTIDDAGSDGGGTDAGVVADGGIDAGTDGSRPPTGPATGTFASVPGTEVVVIEEVDNLFGYTLALLAFAAGRGVVIHDMADGSVAFDFSEPGATETTYRAFPVLVQDPSGARLQSVFSIGSFGYSNRGFSETGGTFGFAQLGAFSQNITDAQRIFSATSALLTIRILLVNNSLGAIEELVAGDFGLESTTLVTGSDIAAAGVSGSAVSIHASDDGARFVGVTDSDLFYYDGSAVSLIGGALGTGLRLLDCASGICAVPDFVAGEILVFRWDGLIAPTITGLVRIPIAGAVSVEVRDDGRLIVPSSTTNTVHSVGLDGSLAVSEDVSCAVSATGAAPFHASWVGATDLAVTDVNSDDSIHVRDTSACP